VKAATGEAVAGLEGGGGGKWTESKATNEVLEREVITVESFQLAVERRSNLASMVKEAVL
jgi:hypothetical protein